MTSDTDMATALSLVHKKILTISHQVPSSHRAESRRRPQLGSEADEPDRYSWSVLPTIML